MNKTRLQRSIQFRIKLRPVARRFLGERELKSIDDDWIVTNVGSEAKGVEIRNTRTDHVIRLAYDRIHHFSEDVARNWNGLSHGFFELRSQVVLSGSRAELQPLSSYCPNCRAATSRRKTIASIELSAVQKSNSEGK